MIDPETISWLKCLISSYDQEHDWDGDGDPSATEEMLRECRHILAELEKQYPACAGCHGRMAAPGSAEGLCHECVLERLYPVVVDESDIPF